MSEFMNVGNHRLRYVTPMNIGTQDKTMPLDLNAGRNGLGLRPSREDG